MQIFVIRSSGLVPGAFSIFNLRLLFCFVLVLQLFNTTVISVTILQVVLNLMTTIGTRISVTRLDSCCDLRPTLRSFLPRLLNKSRQLLCESSGHCVDLASLIDFTYQKPAGKVTDGQHMTLGHCNCTCQLHVDHGTMRMARWSLVRQQVVTHFFHCHCNVKWSLH